VIVTWLSKINLFPAVFSIVTAEVTKPPKINSVVFFHSNRRKLCGHRN
jgi:hypothetical protein